MTHKIWITVLLLIAWLGTGPAAFAQGEAPLPPTPQPVTPLPIPEDLPLPQETEPPSFAALSDTVYQSSTPLRAVLVVGEIDGPSGSWTQSEVANMELAAQELQSYGVLVSRFYPPNNDWEQVKTTAQGAQFFFYRGHGISWTSGSQPLVGGFYMHERFISPDEIRSGLHLAQNAIVMIYSCYSAGSAGSDLDLSSTEAQRRVAQYSDPFFDNGAAGYFANWYGDAFQKFIRYLFQGKTLGQAYETFYDYNSTTVERYIHPNHPAWSMWLDKYRDASGVKYNNAFAGAANKKLLDLFPASAMFIDPGSLTYQVLAETSSKVFNIRVESTGATFSWTALPESDPDWMNIFPLTGESGDVLQVMLDPAGLPDGTYTTNLTIHTSTPGVGPSEKVVPVTLKVRCELDNFAFMPFITN